MRSASSTAILEIIQNKLIAPNNKTELKIEVDVNGSWELSNDLNIDVGVDWSEGGKNEKFATIALTPLVGEITFVIKNENGKYSDGSGTSFENYYDNGTRVRLKAGYNVGDNLSTSTESLSLNSITGDIVGSYFYGTKYVGSSILLDIAYTNALAHFTDLFVPLYDSETYDDSTYTPLGYTVQTYDSYQAGYEQFNKVNVTANNTNGKIYYRTFDSSNDVGFSVLSDWTYGADTINGVQEIDFTDIVNERFIQFAIIYDSIGWSGGQEISDITVTIQSSIEWIYTSVYELDTPEYDDPPTPITPMVYCSGRDAWKKSIETDINISDYSGANISPTNFIKSIADKCNIKYNATSIDTISGLSDINWSAGLGEVKKGNEVFELIMHKINSVGYQMYMQYDITLDDMILYVTLKPDTLEADGVFSYRNYTSIGNNRKNYDKMLQRYTVYTDEQVVDAEMQLDQESISSTGTTVFSWAGDAIYKRFNADLPDNITATVTVTPTSASLVVTAITGTVVVTLYGNKWSSAPSFEGEAINFYNQIHSLGSTSRTINPLLTSDTECKTASESFISDFATPIKEAQGLIYPYVNLLPEINGIYMLWRRFNFNDNLYYSTKISHHWDRAENPSENTTINFDDSGRNFDETSDFIYDQVMDYDRGFLYDMGISTPLSTQAEIDNASIIVHNVSFS